jgi:hypothetical protein
MGQVRKFKVYLEPEQRKRLEAIAHKGHAPVKKIVHAQILLMADQEHPQGRWKDEQIAHALGVHRNTISQVRRRFVEKAKSRRSIAVRVPSRLLHRSWTGRKKPNW